MEKGTNKKGILFVLAAPSGAGKTSIANEIINRLSKNFPISKVITYSTRTPRTGEINGKDYFFLSHDDFLKKQKENFFLETTVYDEKLYGSPASILTDLDLGKSFIAVTDIAGAHTIAKLHQNSVLIWMQTKDTTELKKRLIKRGVHAENQLEKRLQMAEEEIKESHKSRLFHYRVVNDVFDQTVSELVSLIKEKLSA